jgi:hypothetical protein
MAIDFADEYLRVVLKRQLDIELEIDAAIQRTVVAAVVHIHYYLAMAVAFAQNDYHFDAVHILAADYNTKKEVLIESADNRLTMVVVVAVRRLSRN